MARGGSDTFGDGLYKLIQEIGRLKLAPDTDLEFLASLEQMVLDRYKASDPTTSVTGQPAPEPGMEPPLGGSAEPVPVTPVEPLSRGPAPTADMAGLTEELSRVMSGA